MLLIVHLFTAHVLAWTGYKLIYAVDKLWKLLLYLASVAQIFRQI